MAKGPEHVDLLLVEDNPTDAELCIRALEKHDLANNLLWVKDGAEALDFIFNQDAPVGHEAAKPKVVLLDLRLPKVDGLEVLRRVKADERTKTIPIVVLTSSMEGSDVAESYKLGVNSFIAKPVEFKAFAETIARLGLYWLVTNQPAA